MSTDKKKRKQDIVWQSPTPIDEDDESDEAAPGRSKKAKTSEEHSLNTNISVLKSLKWEPNRCIRELLLNSTDADPDATVEKVDENTWIIKNAVKAGKKSLRKKNFSYTVNKEKVEDRLQNGKFGYGLKDAVVLLTAHRIQYVARSVYGSFTAHANKRGDVYVRIDPNDGITDGVEQTLSIGNDIKLSRKDLRRQIKRAQDQCIAFRVRGPYKDYETVEVCDSFPTPLGTVYIPPTDSHGETEYDGASELFVHGCAYRFYEEGQRKPLALIYNLHMDKSAIEGRDRANGLPMQWESALRLLIKEAPESVFDRLVQLRKLHGHKFYEFSNQNFNTYINAHVTARSKETQRIRAVAEAAARDAENARKAQIDAQREVQDAKKKCQPAEAHDLAAIHLRRYEKELAAREEEERIATKRAEKAQAIAVKKEKEAESASLFAAPTVLIFRKDAKVPPGVNAQPLHILSTKDPRWVQGEVPTLEEFLLMEGCAPPIERKYTPLFRQLRRLLYVLGLENKLAIDHSDAAVPDNTLVSLCGTTLHVRFDATEMGVLHAAIHALSSAGLFTKLIGCTPDEAMAQVSNLMLQLTPEEPTEIAGRTSTVLSKFLGEQHSPAVVKSFCPLLVATEWDTKCGGISSFNIQLAKGLATELRRAGGSAAATQPVVYIMVLGTDKTDDATRAQWRDAAQYGIHIVEGSRLCGVYTPCLTGSEFARITHIVGHAHITGTEAANMRHLQQLKHAKLWQINHVLPLEADTLKEGGTAQSRQESARKKEAILVALNEEADHVFSVGAMMFDHFEHQLDKRGRAPGTNHTQLILPLNPDFLDHPTMKSDFPAVGGGSIHILYFGRTESVFFLKGMDVAMRAVEQANKNDSFSATQRNIVLTVRGTKTGMEAATVQKLIALQKEEHRDVAPYVACFASPAEVMLDLHQTHMVIMPSRNEPFGLVATEAIACRVPVLVSNNSGIARLLTEHHMKDLCVQTSVHHPDEAAASALQADVDAWSNAIVKLINGGPAAFKRAKTLAATLKDAIPAPYSKMIELGAAATESKSDF